MSEKLNTFYLGLYSLKLLSMGDLRFCHRLIRRWQALGKSQGLRVTKHFSCISKQGWMNIILADKVTANTVFFITGTCVNTHVWLSTADIQESISVLRIQIQNYVKYLQCQKVSLWHNCKSKWVQNYLLDTPCTEYLQKTKTRTSVETASEPHRNLCIYACICSHVQLCMAVLMNPFATQTPVHQVQYHFPLSLF